MAELVAVAPEVWDAIELGIRQGHHPRTVMVEWWRLVLGMSVEEWEAVEPGGVSVMDYEVSPEDGERLHSIIMEMPGDVVPATTWLDLGPKIAH